MCRVDLTYPTPEENLAADEALLDACEDGGSAALRFHEPASFFVVVGFGNRVATEVNEPACAAAGVPVLRRVSGGGTVLLGPGCLAYALAMPISDEPEFESVSGTNRLVMDRNRAAIERCSGKTTEICGHTDLAIGGLKFSGNAQRRRRRALLFHGTILLCADLAAIGRYLRAPSREPDYRRGRDHAAFVTNLGVDASVVKAALAEAWSAREPYSAPLGPRMGTLLVERYRRAEWHARL